MPADLGIPDAPVASNVPASNVPAALSSFVGRAGEVATLRALLGATRLLTVVGPGGGGKTRIARELAAGEAAAGRGPVWWVELASIAAGGDDEILQAVAGVVGARASLSGDVGAAVVAALTAAGDALVVLDNCEHVVDAAARGAERLLRACPRLTLLATSREALGAEGEVAWQLPPLGRPAAGASTPDDLADSDAVALFVDRARAALPGFALAAANAPAVATVCVRLDGLPLAIELAAAALPTLGVEGVAARLDDALGLLTRGRRTALPRHRTLRAVLDWSYALLDPAAQALLARLSVFRGAFTLDAAEAVGGRGSRGSSSGHDLPAGNSPAGELPGGAAVLDALGRLVEHSLVDLREGDRGARESTAASGEPRYALLETVRQYGADRLRGTPDEIPTRRRHADWVTQLAEAAGPLLLGAARVRTLDRLHADLDDVRAALTWATGPDATPDDVLLAARTAWALSFLWMAGMPWDEGRRWLRLTVDAAERAGLGDRGRPVATRLAFAGATHMLAQMDNTADDAAAALAHADRMDVVLGTVAADLAALRADDDPRWAADRRGWDDTLRGLRALMRDVRAEAVLRSGGAPDDALAHADAALAGALPLAHPWHATVLRTRRAAMLDAFGRHDEAASEFVRAAADFRASGDVWMLSLTLQGQAVNALALGDVGAAAAHAAAAAVALGPNPEPWFLARALDALAAACTAAGGGSDATSRTRAAVAARLLGAAHVLRVRGGTTATEIDGPLRAAATAAAEPALGPAAFAEERAAGAALPVDAMLALAESGVALVNARVQSTPAPSTSAVQGAPLPGSTSPERARPERAADAGAASVVALSASPRIASDLRIEALGGLAVRRDGRMLSDAELAGGKVRELLLWFILHPKGGTKEDAGVDLWPDASAAHLRSSFHVTLHRLRRALGDPRWVTCTGAAYALAQAPAPGAPADDVTSGPGAVLDVDVHAVLAAADALRQAVRRVAGRGPDDLARAVPDDTLDAARTALARYRGPLVTATGLGLAAGDWITAHRDRLHAAWADGTSLLGVIESAAGRHADAVAAFGRVLAADPLREGVHRALMQAHAAAGEPGRALAHYDALAALLARELGAAPARETQALAERLRVP